MVRDFRVLQRQSNGKSAIEMRSDPCWIRRLGKEYEKAINKCVGKRRQRLNPPPTGFRLMTVELGCEHQQPRPSVRALENPAHWLMQVVDLGSHLCRGELLLEELPDLVTLADIGKNAQDR